MDIARSLFKSTSNGSAKVAVSTSGYMGKEQIQVQINTALSDDEITDDGPNIEGRDRYSTNVADEYDTEKTHVAEFLATFTPLKGGPFSAVIPSLIPQDIVVDIRDSNSHPDVYSFDEFGFFVDAKVDQQRCSSDTENSLSKPFVEDSQWRLTWLARINFDGGNEISWENVQATLPHSDIFAEMVKKGIPHSLRSQLWMRFSNALSKKQQSKYSYRDIMKMCNVDELAASIQIEKDVYRCLPGNACFNRQTSTGSPRLRRVLRAISYVFNQIGYCQGMGTVLAYLLLVMEEEDAFWMMVTILEDILPATYYTSGMCGVLADVRVLRSMVKKYLPKVDEMLDEHDCDLGKIFATWLPSLFGNVVHVKVLIRIWDLLFFYGSVTLIRIAIAFVKLTDSKIVEATCESEILEALTDTVRNQTDIDELIKVSFEMNEQITEEVLTSERNRFHAYLMLNSGVIHGSVENYSTLPKQRLNRRSIRKSKSMIQLILFGDDNETESDVKNKNIKQTELLLNLREAILRIAHHFISIDSKLSDVSLVCDYSVESHTRDHENYNIVSRNRRRRAKALLDFEKHDEDELGFRKNDIITIISQKDEHCWIGELNEQRGWFPAKFVEILDERSKQYSTAGDDSVTEYITDIVRGALCSAIKQILEHGMKKPSFLGGPCHPWLFIEEAAVKEVEKDFTSVYSRLILCRTYRLDEDGKVLTPEELLYRCIQVVNQTHDEAHTQMDVKFRSLICLGLNEQVLHLWLEVLCSCVEVVHKWYHPWSFVYSPGWVQVKCELRILSQFPFNLNAEWELPQKKEKSQPLKDGVRDMLVKHHLFSWDL